MKNNLVIIVAISILALSFIDAKPREKRNSDGDSEESEASGVKYLHLSPLILSK